MLLDVTTDSDISQDTFIAGEVPAVSQLVSGAVEVLTTSVGTLALTFRWTHNGNPRSFQKTVALSVSGNYQPFAFHTLRDDNTNLTYEVDLTGVIGTPSYRLNATIYRDG